jgi:hypothetical protein
MISRESGHITVTQRNYILTLVERYGMAYSLLTMDTDRTVRSSLEGLYCAYWQYDDDAPCNKKKYHGLVGALLYCSTGTRPDIVRAMSIVCSKSSVPTYGDWRKALRILQWLSAVQRSPAQCSALQRSTAQCIAVHRSASQCKPVHHSTAQCIAVQRKAAQYSAVSAM